MAKKTKEKAEPASWKKQTQTIQKPGFIERNALKIAIAFAVVALILRVYRLGYFSLWVDEYMHGFAAMKGKFTHGENNGILLTWINTSLAFIIGHKEFALRLPVAILGAALIPAVYVLGNRISGYRIGLMAAILCTFSLFLMVWSRVDRPYGMVGAFYIPLLLCFWLMLEKESSSFLGKLGFHPKYALLMLLAFLLCMLSQLICFLFVFSAGFYGMFMAIDSWVTGKSKPHHLKNAYNILFYLNIIAVVLMFTPVGAVVTKPVLELFLPVNIVTFILPDLNNIIAILEGDKWNKCFNTYTDVLNTDFKWVAVLGWAGFILALLKDRKFGYFLIAAFVVPFLLMSFIFTSTSHAKYLIQLYPFFILSAVYSLYYIAYHLAPYLNKSFSVKNKKYNTFCTAVFIILVIYVTPRNDISYMLKTEAYGNVVSSKLSEVSYVNWRQPCEFVMERKKKNDIVMATVQFAPRYYLELDSVVWFRQMHLNPKWSLNVSTEERYIPNKPDGKKVSAYTHDQLVQTFKDNPRGWLLADYYFDNALTDANSKQFVIQNMTYHFDASYDGGVKVFSWDHNVRKEYQATMCVELGKSARMPGDGGMPASEEMQFNMASVPAQPRVILLTKGIDTDTEAILIINGQQFSIKSSPTKTGDAFVNLVEIKPNILKQGANTLQFAYNTEASETDIERGFVVLNMEIQ